MPEYIPITPKRGTDSDTTWDADAACKNHPKPDLWFGTPGSVALMQAKNICADCPALTRMRCLAEALETPESEDWGVWGGLDEHERKKMRRLTA